MRNSHGKFIAAIASAAAVLVMSVGAGSAAASAPTTWQYVGYTLPVSSSPANPITVTVGTEPAVVCPAVHYGAVHNSNAGVPLQGYLRGNVYLKCGPGAAVALGFNSVAFKEPFSLSFSGLGETPFRVITPAGTWNVAAPAYSGAWDNLNQVITFAPGTPVGTTTVGGLPVTIAGTLKVQGPLRLNPWP